MAKMQESESGQALDPWDDPANDVQVMPAPTADVLEVAYRAIRDGVLPDGVVIGSSDVTAQAIQDQIRQGKSFDDVFAPSKLKAWQDLAGEPVLVRRFHLNPSTIKNETPGKGPSPAVYAVVEIVRGSGEVELVQCGGGNVLTQLVKAWEHGWLPCKLKIVASEVRGSGNTVLRLEKADS
jgi:hypothetical protein